ncbi:MAG: hypothetical protein MUE70_17090, partial [Desulfobacterales bacterium]|nr:hypothetical protein [Desulfobacterales bacterium]
MKKWQCTVCGYIHNGDEPPETCPVCGADRTQFVEIKDAKESSATKEPIGQTSLSASSSMADASPSSILDLANNLMIQHHLHPISVHIPNGMVPAIVLFIFLA